MWAWISMLSGSHSLKQATSTTYGDQPPNLVEMCVQCLAMWIPPRLATFFSTLTHDVSHWGELWAPVHWNLFEQGAMFTEQHSPTFRSISSSREDMNNAPRYTEVWKSSQKANYTLPQCQNILVLRQRQQLRGKIHEEQLPLQGLAAF